MSSDSDASSAAPQRAQALKIDGRAGGRLWSAPVRVVMALTGISLLVGLGQLFARWVLGYKRQGWLTLNGQSLTFEEKRQMAGRVTHEDKETFGRPDVLSARLEKRYPLLPTLLGLTGLGLGVIIGLLWLLDGVQGEFTPWILAGVGLLLGGVVLDLVMTTVASSLPGTVTVVLRLPQERVVRLIGCEPESAEKVVLWLHRREG